MPGRTSRADLRLEVRLVVALLALLGLGSLFLLLALLVRDNWGPLIRLDRAVADAMTGPARRSDAVLWALKATGRLIEPTWFRAVALGLAIWLFVRRRVRLGAWVLVTGVVGGAIGPFLKEVVGRARPVLDQPVAHAGGFSFPSGHAYGSVVGVGVVLLVLGPLLRTAWRRAAWVAGVLLVLVVGVDRLALGVHYLSDVVAGWVVGVAWLAVTAAVFPRLAAGRRAAAGAAAGDRARGRGERGGSAHRVMITA